MGQSEKRKEKKKKDRTNILQMNTKEDKKGNKNGEKKMRKGYRQ